jgi:RNA polymerase sigma-70 factor (ECF subfamily)
VKSIDIHARGTLVAGSRDERGCELALHRRYLLGRARLHLGQPDLAEDVVQETLLAAYLAFNGFERRSRTRTWLVGILRHKIADALRSRMRERFTDLDADEACSELPGPESNVDSRELFGVIDAHLAGLPSKHAAAFVMRDAMDHTTEDICAELGITSNHLFVVLHRTRRGLRRTLAAHGFQPAPSVHVQSGAAR